jgi:4-alpha-glucanotransferase
VKNGLSKQSYEETIHELAASYGIQPEYRDTWGRVHQISLDTKRNILDAFGVDVDTEAAANAAHIASETRQCLRLAEPTIVATISLQPNDLVFQIPHLVNRVSGSPETENLNVSLEVTHEQGGTECFEFGLKDLTFRDTKRLGNTAWERWSLPFPRLRILGYYLFCLTVRADGHQWSQNIFVAMCPGKAFIPPALQGDERVAGVAIHLYGVRSERNWGIGDLGDLQKIVTWAAKDLHANLIALNPLHATFNRKPYNTSPYLPMSRYYRNFVYLDIPAMRDYQDSAEAQAVVNRPQVQRLLSDLRAAETVQYEEVARLKLEVLKRTFQTFLTNHWQAGKQKTSRRKEFEKYIKREGSLLDNFAAFCAIDSVLRSRQPGIWIWSQWPPEYQRADTESVREFKEEHWREVLFHKFIQWQLEKQLSRVQKRARDLGMCIGLFHDLALAVDQFSADFWAYQDFFIARLRVGAPPDAFSQHGQDWGFSPPNTERLRQIGYDLFIKEIRRNCASGGALRIDHVMRLFRLYCIPEGMPPRDGAYVLQPFEDLLRIVALESVKNQVIIVGEDLGTVPEDMRSLLAQANVLSYRLLYFEKDNQENFILPQHYPELALVTVTTHDLPTLFGFWTGRDIGVRASRGIFDTQAAVLTASEEREADKKKLLAVLQDLNLLSKGLDTKGEVSGEFSGDLQKAVIAFLAMTPAKLFVLNQEDLFREKDQQNLPGTTVEYPNWSVKMKYTVEQLSSDPEARALCNIFRTIVEESGRIK